MQRAKKATCGSRFLFQAAARALATGAPAGHTTTALQCCAYVMLVCMHSKYCTVVGRTTPSQSVSYLNIVVQHTVPSEPGQYQSSMRTDVNFDHSDGALSMGGSTTGNVKFRGWHVLYSIVRPGTRWCENTGLGKVPTSPPQYRPNMQALQDRCTAHCSTSTPYVLCRKRSTPRHYRLLQYVRTTPSRKPIGRTKQKTIGRTAVRRSTRAASTARPPLAASIHSQETLGHLAFARADDSTTAGPCSAALSSTNTDNSSMIVLLV